MHKISKEKRISSKPKPPLVCGEFGSWSSCFALTVSQDFGCSSSASWLLFRHYIITTSQSLASTITAQSCGLGVFNSLFALRVSRCEKSTGIPGACDFQLLVAVPACILGSFALDQGLCVRDGLRCGRASIFDCAW